MSEKRNFKGVWIPAGVWLNRSLSVQEKIMLIEIDSLQDSVRGCYKSNASFAAFFDLSVSRISRVISSLESKGFVRVVLIRKDKQIIERRIYVAKRLDESPENGDDNLLPKQRDPSAETPRPLLPKQSDPCCGNASVSNTSLGDTSLGGSLSSKPDIALKVIQHLNDKTGSKFRATKTNTKFIDARIAEGATPTDLIAVINRKCLEWLDNPEMRQYLRPSTLFNAEKFNTYVGQLDSPLPVKRQAKQDHMSRHTGFDEKDYKNGLIEQEDGSYAF